MKKSLLIASALILSATLVCGASLKVTAPSGGEVCLGGSCPISWTASGISAKVKLQLVKPGGALVGLIAGNLDAGSSPYNWTAGAPAVAGQSYKIRVSSQDGSFTATSTDSFLIKTCAANPPPPPPGTPKLEVTSPAGGVLLLGQSSPILWKAAHVSQKVKLLLLRADKEIGDIASGLEAAAIAPYNWSNGQFKGGSAPRGNDYRIRVQTMDNSVKGVSAVFSLASSLPDNLPTVKSQVELMQQPPAINPNILETPPNTLVLSQLPKAKIITYESDKKSINQGEKIIITITAANITEAVVIEEGVPATSHGLTSLIKNGNLQHSFSVQPQKSGAFRLLVNNQTSKAEDNFYVTVVAQSKPSILEFTPNKIQFNSNEKIELSFHVSKAEYVALLDDLRGGILEDFPTPSGQGDFKGTFNVSLAHTCQLIMKARNKAGETFSPVIKLVCSQEIPLLHEFTPYRKAILGIPTDTVVVAYKLRGAKAVWFSRKHPDAADIPSNYIKLLDLVLNGQYREHDFEDKPSRFPYIYRMITEFWNGMIVTDTLTIK